MQVHYHPDNLPAFRNPVITIGTFDGVHLGHRQVLTQLTEEARRVNGESVIITFQPHPRKIVSPAMHDIRLINTLEEKISLLSALHIDHLVVVPFTERFSGLSAEEYLSEFLVRLFKPHTIIIGYDHRFGKNRQGDYQLMEKMAGVYGYRIKEIPKHILDDIAVSSTKIREAILHADMDTANRMLGYEYFFTGKVVKGDGLGKEFGYPTANIQMEDEEKIIPGNGIFAVYAKTDDWPERKKGMMSIGIRPTLGKTSRQIEVHLFEVNENLYGSRLTVWVKKFLREEIRFDSVTELIEQMHKDRIESLKIL
ncbi:MAG: bifunctional riboflavin kinase/FAD synthetase [Chitinophagaceae bacterium]|nr:bifunctional riboflavin kinase/FAD synthetase [Chitinophagaceae bacterium]